MIWAKRPLNITEYCKSAAKAQEEAGQLAIRVGNDFDKLPDSVGEIPIQAVMNSPLIWRCKI